MVGSKAEQGGIIKQRRQADQRGVELDGAALLPDGRRQLRRRQLRHVGQGVRPAVHLHLAEPPHRRDGSEAARRRDGHRRPQRRRRPRRRGRRGGARRPDRRARGADRGRVDGAVRDRAGLGRRDHPPAPTRARCWGWRSRPPHSNVVEGATRVRRCGGTDDPPPADRQPRRDRGADRAAPHARWASRPSACTPSPIATRCTSTPSTSPSRSAGRRPAESYLRGDAIIAAALRHRVRRRPSRLRLPRRERRRSPRR